MLEDHARSSLLYKLLLPWTERNIVMGSGSGCWGSTDRFLGRLTGSWHLGWKQSATSPSRWR